MYGIRYAEFVVPLVQAAQELNAKIESQQLVIELQQMQMNYYEASISHLIDELKALKSEVQANTDAVSLTNK
jgi:arginine repressor